MKPVAQKISTMPPRRTVLYRCPKCDAGLAVLATRAQYCYHCGTKLEWEGITVTLAEPFWTEKNEAEFIDRLNVSQLGHDYEKLYKKDRSPLSCSDCISLGKTGQCTNKAETKQYIIIPPRLSYPQGKICIHFKPKCPNL